MTDTTPWIKSPKARSVFLWGEHLADRYRLDHPFGQLCTGDASILDDDALAEIACVHPSSEGFSRRRSTCALAATPTSRWTANSTLSPLRCWNGS